MKKKSPKSGRVPSPASAKKRSLYEVMGGLLGWWCDLWPHKDFRSLSEISDTSLQKKHTKKGNLPKSLQLKTYFFRLVFCDFVTLGLLLCKKSLGSSEAPEKWSTSRSSFVSENFASPGCLVHFCRYLSWRVVGNFCFFFFSGDWNRHETYVCIFGCFQE